MLNELFIEMQPHVVPAVTMIAGAILTAAAGVIAVSVRRAEKWVEDKYGIDIEDKHARTLTAALETGVVRLMDKFLDGYLSREEVIDGALEYARRSSPDAVAYFGSPEEVMENKAEAALNEAVMAAPLPAA